MKESGVKHVQEILINLLTKGIQMNTLSLTV